MFKDESIPLKLLSPGQQESRSQGPTIIHTTTPKASGSDAVDTNGKMEVEGTVNPVNLSQALTAEGDKSGPQTTTVLQIGTHVEQDLSLIHI